ncbi:hypothetical protein BN168_560003 [Clostridioides difficile CD002]|nr:hypothetical protein BN167_1400002 [Clostridioides difficile E13]CCL07846.1 hypothetical protein BN168_560003 [Clostridioides difficile CD002]
MCNSSTMPFLEKALQKLKIAIVIKINDEIKNLFSFKMQ